MLQECRHRGILDYLVRKKHVSVNELANKFDVSPVTIRSDLKLLAQQNLLIRTHGGASVIEDNWFNEETSYDLRTKEHHLEKKEIALKAFKLIDNNDCILIDASSTCFELAKLIQKSTLNLTVVTNGILTAELLKDNHNITTILIGGIIKGRSNAIESTLGVGLLNNINCNKLFVSAKAFNLEDGLSEFNLYEVELKKIMITHVQKLFALMDVTKLEKQSLLTFANCESIDALVTNESIPKAIKEKYIKHGVNII
ncbi:transcriptional regulator, DeoR family [Granulicatella balaenopterae]|uniref:Transcriptional regulator, DeoR family n=1 Tax=Granulicatella balaenopterae TaxID=137733 RepID=A0A1H9P2M4_9LACT|nr:DeoR/GlpR family DNA-binding transcription regulator [Granulicatella balaenopterae]SER42476.1 transcriptional regulator, DeoR family [Granulicatella balaenopterae]